MNSRIKVLARRMCGVAAVASTLVSAAGGVHAAEKERSSLTLEEIVVTAQKREERAIDVPMSIDVLSAHDIERKGIVSMRDLAYASPGMVVQEFGPGRQVVYMRGVGNRVGDSAITGIYLDEVSANTGGSDPGGLGQLDLETMDLERVEVLKGPQGTLYGAGSVSGTVRLITADPKLDRFGAKGDITTLFTEGGDPTQRATAVLNAPVVENVFGLRAAISFQNNGGWIDRPDAGWSNTNHTRRTDVRLKGLWKPSDALSLEAMAIVHRNSDNDSGGLSHSNPDGTYRLAVDPDRRVPFHDDYELYNLTATFDFGYATLLSSSSYTYQDARYLYAYISGPETAFFGYDYVADNNTNVRTLSQEVRLSSSGQGALQWTTGLFYRDADQSSAAHGDSVYLGSPFSSVSKNTGDSESYAIFGNITYAVTDKLELGMGARYFDEDRGLGSVFAEDQGPGTVLPPSSEQSGSFNKLTWRASASYALRERAKVYVSAATGFRSGGFSTFGFPPYKPENLLTYELGTKMQSANGNVHMDAALFYSDYSDYLRNGLLFNPNTSSFVSAISNVGEVTIKGAELSLSAAVTDHLSFNVSGSYTDSELTRLDPSAVENGGPSLGQEGDPVDYIPKRSFSAGAEYEFKWAEGVPGFFRLDYNYRDKISVINRGLMAPAFPIMYSDSTEIVNARLGAAWGRWSVQLFGENLTDENGSFDPWVYWAQAVRNRPRTYGLQVAVDFE